MFVVCTTRVPSASLQGVELVKLKIGVNGAAGRMGQRVTNILVIEFRKVDFKLSAVRVERHRLDNAMNRATQRAQSSPPRRAGRLVVWSQGLMGTQD